MFHFRLTMPLVMCMRDVTMAVLCWFLSLCIYLIFFACCFLVCLLFLTACFWRNKDAYTTDFRYIMDVLWRPSKVPYSEVLLYVVSETLQVYGDTIFLEAETVGSKTLKNKHSNHKCERQSTCLIATAQLGHGSSETVPPPPWPSGDTHVYIKHTHQTVANETVNDF